MPLVSLQIKANVDMKKYQKDFMKQAHHAIEMVTFGWEAEAKKLFTVEGHVVTGRARASVNNSAGSPPNYIDASKAKADDGIHKEQEELWWVGGSNVEYMPELEKRYNIFARAIENIRPRVNQIVADAMTDVL